jgi:hypothetical protein
MADYESWENSFWRPGHGALHYGLASPDPAVRAGYVKQAAAAAAAAPGTMTWTNSPALARDPRVGLHDASAAGLLGIVRPLAQARLELEGGDAAFAPGARTAVLVLILDLPDGMGDYEADVHALLMTGRRLGISVTLVLPSLELGTIDRAAREMLIKTPPPADPRLAAFTAATASQGHSPPVA